MSDILIGIISLALGVIVLGLIVGCIRYWTRQPYDDDLSFKDFVWGGIVYIIKKYSIKIGITAILLIIVLILSQIFG